MDRQTDGQTTCNLNTALCTIVHRAVKSIAPGRHSARLRSAFEEVVINALSHQAGGGFCPTCVLQTGGFCPT